MRMRTEIEERRAEERAKLREACMVAQARRRIEAFNRASGRDVMAELDAYLKNEKSPGANAGA
jgi:hypothetical protein